MTEKEQHVGFNLDFNMNKEESSRFSKNFKMSFDTFNSNHYANQIKAFNYKDNLEDFIVNKGDKIPLFGYPELNFDNSDEGRDKINKLWEILTKCIISKNSKRCLVRDLIDSVKMHENMHDEFYGFKVHNERMRALSNAHDEEVEGIRKRKKRRSFHSSKKLIKLGKQFTNKFLGGVEESYISSPKNMSTLNNSHGYSTKKSSHNHQAFSQAIDLKRADERQGSHKRSKINKRINRTRASLKRKEKSIQHRNSTSKEQVSIKDYSESVERFKKDDKSKLKRPKTAKIRGLAQSSRKNKSRKRLILSTKKSKEESKLKPYNEVKVEKNLFDDFLNIDNHEIAQKINYQRLLGGKKSHFRSNKKLKRKNKSIILNRSKLRSCKRKEYKKARLQIDADLRANLATQREEILRHSVLSK